MRCVVLARSLFETGSDVEHRLSEEVKELKIDLKTQIEKFDEVSRHCTQLSKEKKSPETFLANIRKEVERLKGTSVEIKELRKENEDLEASLKEAQLKIISTSDDAFKRDKAQVLVFHPGMNVDAMDYFKVIKNGE